ncbi:MAG: DUF2797 domain-containing protein [Gammaproteobacteria bacterium]|jgi:hypothetical protein
MKYTGNITKMVTALNKTVKYTLPIGDNSAPMNELIGSNIKLIYNNEINCIYCGRKTNKSFNQGYCYPCFRSLAQCDTCIIKPEQCHYFEGTCREPEWGEEHCMQDHFVYLANSSGIKVGITRGSQIPTRWMDQGASQALPIFKVKNRLISGQLEVILKNHVADKTDWRKMLKGEAEPKELSSIRDELVSISEKEITALDKKLGDGGLQFLENEEQVEISYPVETYPTKVTSFNFDKTAEVSGVLNGIKGQYLILDSGVLNIRKFGGYNITMESK